MIGSTDDPGRSVPVKQNEEDDEKDEDEEVEDERRQHLATLQKILAEIDSSVK